MCAPLGAWASLAFWLGRRGHRWMPCRRHARLSVVAQMPSDAAASCISESQIFKVWVTHCLRTITRTVLCLAMTLTQEATML